MRKINKGMAAILALVILLAVLGGCGKAPANSAAVQPEESSTAPVPSANSGTDAAEYTIKIGHTCALNHPYHIAAEKFQEMVEERTNGRIKVEIYPSSQLGGERDMIEGMQAGTVEMGAVSIGVASAFVDGSDIFNLPFVFDGIDHFMQVAEGEIGQKYIDKVNGQKGLKIMAITYPVFRIPFSRVGPLTTIDSFRGVKIRTMEVPAHMDAYQMLGASPTPTASSEQFLAYQMGTLDAGENSITTIYSEKYYENCPDIAEIPVVCGCAFWMMSQKFYESLPEDLRQIIDDAGEELGRYTNELTLQLENENKALIEEAGGTFYQVDDLTPFKEAVAPVLEKYKAEIEPWAVALLEEIEALVN